MSDESIKRRIHPNAPLHISEDDIDYPPDVCGEVIRIDSTLGEHWVTTCLQRPNHDGPHSGLVTWNSTQGTTS